MLQIFTKILNLFKILKYWIKKWNIDDLIYLCKNDSCILTILKCLEYLQKYWICLKYWNIVYIFLIVLDIIKFASQSKVNTQSVI